MATRRTRVVVDNVLFWSDPLQVRSTVVRFVVVLVVDVVRALGPITPACGHHPVQQPSATNGGIPVGAWSWLIGQQVSENGSSARNSIEMIVEPKGCAFYRDAKHEISDYRVWGESN